MNNTYQRTKVLQKRTDIYLDFNVVKIYHTTLSYSRIQKLELVIGVKYSLTLYTIYDVINVH